MYLIFCFLISAAPILIIAYVVLTAIKNSKNQHKNNGNKDFDEVFKKIERESKNFNEEDRVEVLNEVQQATKKYDTDKELEEELVRRFKALDDKQSHDDACQESSCDGCGSEDVYAQVYGKRKRNKIKKK